MAKLNDLEILGFVKNGNRAFTIVTHSPTGGETDSFQTTLTVDNDEQAEAVVALFGNIFRTKVAETAGL